MYILAKSALKKEDIIAKSLICKDIELQLFNEFENDNDCVEQLYSMVTSIPDINIQAVHSPIIDGEDINIEFIDNATDYFRLFKTIELAGLLSNFYNHEIKVIIHTAFRFDNYKRMPYLLEKIEYFIKMCLQEYDKITICFENVVPCKFNGDDLFLRNGCLFDNVKLAKYLKEKLNTNRIGTVLDTCHMLVTIRALKKLFKDGYLNKVKEINIERYFIENKEIIKLIHLCNVDHLGYNKGEHGILFRHNGDDINLLSELINFYKEYQYRCDITIEIAESNYIENENFKNNYPLIKCLLEANSIL